MSHPPCPAAVLEELQEFAALGFYEGLDLPWPRAYGLAARHLYERMPIYAGGKQIDVTVQ